MAIHSPSIERRAKKAPAARPKHSAHALLDIAEVTLDADGAITLSTVCGSDLHYQLGRRPPALRPGRLTYSESAYRSHEEVVRGLTRKNKCPFDSPELSTFIAPTLNAWAKSKSNLDLLELGPSHTTTIPDALNGTMRSYTAVDFSPPFLRKQRELLAEEPGQLERCRHIVADTYELTLPASSFDLVVVSCHPPLVSATVQDKILVLNKIHGFLKSGGTLAVFPWLFAEQPAAVTQHLLSLFKLKQAAHRDGNCLRMLLFFEKQ